MWPNEIQEIEEVFNLTSRDLANALNVAPLTVARWESGQSNPTGLQEEVLRALHSTALEVRGQKNAQQAKIIRGLIVLGVGALIYYLLSKR